MYDKTFRVVIFGDHKVGRATLSENFLHSCFPIDQMNIGIMFFTISIKIKDKHYVLSIWSITQRFRFLHPGYVKGANGAIYLYDITNSESLNHLHKFIDLIREISGDIPIMLIGNKLDLEKNREVSREQGINIAEKYKLSGYGEISAITGQNVDITFETLTEIMIERSLQKKPDTKE